MIRKKRRKNRLFNVITFENKKYEVKHDINHRLYAKRMTMQNGDHDNMMSK